ncbi:MAG: hypothetical protein O6759_01230 [Candidatus Dadabacteria bacterium]|nr:hypothetical protein [Candidatus Dadabacteria bacterium]
MSDNKFSKGEAIRFGWDRMKDNLGFFIVYLIILFSVEFFFSAFAGLFEDSLPFLSLIFNVGLWIVNIISGIFNVKIGLRLYDNERIGSYGFLSFSSSLFFKFLLGYILYLIVVLIGLILLIVPGVYLAIKYQFVTYLIVDKGMGPIEAFKESGKITAGSKWNLFLLIILLLIIVLLGLLAFIVGIFVALPIVMVAVAYVYRKLSSNTVINSDIARSDNPFQPPAPIS